MNAHPLPFSSPMVRAERAGLKMKGHHGSVTVTHSELNTLWSCPWKHRLRYELQLDPPGFDDSGPLRTGSLVHQALAAVYSTIQRVQGMSGTASIDQLHTVAHATLDLARGANEAAALFEGQFADEVRAAFDEDIATARTCIDLFVEHIAPRNAERYDVLGVEMPFRVPLLTTAGRRWGDQLEGVMDLVLRDRALGTVVLAEHKTTVGEAHAYETRLQHDAQAPLYTYALRHLFGDLARGEVVLNVIRKTAPREPSINQDGTVSIAAVDTTRSIYERALAAQGEPEWLTKARALPRSMPEPTGAAVQIAHSKNLAAIEKNESRWRALRAKQLSRAESLGGIERFVAQHEFRVSNEQVQRAAFDAWQAARLIRLFRRGELTPWRVGSACRTFSSLCAYHEPCTEGVIEPGELLVKREHRHREVAEAIKQAPAGVMKGAIDGKS